MWWKNWGSEQKKNPMAAKISIEGFWSKDLKIQCPFCNRVTSHDIGFLDRQQNTFMRCGDAQTGGGSGCGEDFMIPHRPGEPNYNNIGKATISSANLLNVFSRNKKVKCPYCKYEKIVAPDYIPPVDICESCLDFFATR